MVKKFSKGALFLAFALASFVAQADFISVKSKQAILFEGPSITTDKIFIVTEGYPLKVLVNLKDWKKVKDHNGKISWIEAKNTHDERTVLILNNDAVIFNQANDKSHKLANVRKSVVLKLNSKMLIGEWAEVKTQIEGLIGFIHSKDVWGL